MTLYNVEYIRDCTEYNKIRVELQKSYGSYFNYDRIVQHIFDKIKAAADGGKNKTSIKFGYGYCETDKAKEGARKLISKCINILQHLLKNFGYESSYDHNSEGVYLNITW